MQYKKKRAFKLGENLEVPTLATRCQNITCLMAKKLVLPERLPKVVGFNELHYNTTHRIQSQKDCK